MTNEEKLNKAIAEELKNYTLLPDDVVGELAKVDVLPALEKQVPRKLERKCFTNGNIYYACPRCGGTQEVVAYKKDRYCRFCGQSLKE